ncbi:MAG: hypothetical protein JNJ54_30360 [Myxococcaceae bacterium]|nr:hypothetical protein [Myxococcaceae bacterium]
MADDLAALHKRLAELEGRASSLDIITALAASLSFAADLAGFTGRTHVATKQGRFTFGPRGALDLRSVGPTTTRFLTGR